ncbi:MAG: type II 3-dehydroquinate dehydratase [marine benthic group bacterium]|nr:type II 3-dehydroquinate dehydratase [Gemmatimonadota bacterium]MCL7962327.1 type II 3-dehydroquinate dehydratase [Candidatus Carthagonibacter metallireducens]MCL7937122.1 type II 3-dehydroquinate dehydratase [Gemmatimonadota bacterium]MCL7965354.1 type II 3-dehydroquinate dehydratase [Gemmatimonadota bacterium]MCL7967447.1 type II 3-dehydroquinate dehydratase [Gemmatimonadota bacterium]
MRICVLHGPNLNLLGRREPDLYGTETLDEIDGRLRARGEELEVDLVSFQSNHEGDLVDHIQAEASRTDGWLVNAAGLTHSSVALRDALVASGRPFVEVHLTNIFAREPFRRRSLLSDAAIGVVTGFGRRSYLFGLDGLVVALRRDE